MSYSCLNCVYLSPDDPNVTHCLQEGNPAVVAFCQSGPADMSACPGFLLTYLLSDEFMQNVMAYEPFDLLEE
jgi:hypothetical protein